MKISHFTLFCALALSGSGWAGKAALVTEPAEFANVRWDFFTTAKESIYQLAYILKNDRSAHMNIALLREAARAGVDTYLVVDEVGNSCDMKVLYAAAKDGVHIEFYKPHFFSRYGSFMDRMHDKIIVVDGARASLGDINITSQHFNYEADLPENSKTFISREVIIYGSEVAKISRYAKSMVAHGITEPLDLSKAMPWEIQDGAEILDAALKHLPERFLAKHDGWKRRFVDGNLQIFYDEPGAKDPSKGSNRAIIDAIHSAKTSLLIENPYIVLTAEVQDALLKARQRGVTITVLTNSVNSTDSLIVAGGWMGSRKFLTEIGATIYEVKGEVLNRRQRFKKLFRPPSSKASLHSKTIVVDGRVAYLSSYNLDPRSANRNSEIVVKILSKELASQLTFAVQATIDSDAIMVSDGGKLSPHASKCGLFLQGLSRIFRSQI